MCCGAPRWALSAGEGSCTQAGHEQRVAAWPGGQGWAMVPKGWSAGDTSGGACVAGRGSAWRGMSSLQNPGEMAGVWGRRAELHGQRRGQGGLREQHCWETGPDLPQRVLLKKIVGKANFDKLQFLEAIKESLSSLSHIKTL